MFVSVVSGICFATILESLRISAHVIELALSKFMANREDEDDVNYKKIKIIKG